MSKEQPRRAESDEQESSIKSGHGDVFQGEAPSGRSAETNRVFEYIQKNGSNSIIQLAVDAAADSIGGGQVVGQDGQRAPLVPASTMGGAKTNNITIGEALEATALTAGNRPVDYSDAAAIQAAEVRATCRTCIIPGGVAAAAQSAATRNARATKEEEKTKLAEILADASSKLPADKPVTRKDAEGVIGAEIRNDPNLCTRPGGVAASLAAAARLNQSKSQGNNQNNSQNN